MLVDYGRAKGNRKKESASTAKQLQKFMKKLEMMN